MANIRGTCNKDDIKHMKGTILLESGLEPATFSMPSTAFWPPGYRSCHVKIFIDWNTFVFFFLCVRNWLGFFVCFFKYFYYITVILQVSVRTDWSIYTSSPATIFSFMSSLSFSPCILICLKTKKSEVIVFLKLKYFYANIGSVISACSVVILFLTH